MTRPSNRKNPLEVLNDQEARQRRDAVRAFKFVADNLSGEHLRTFISEISAFFGKFVRHLDCEQSQRSEEDES